MRLELTKRGDYAVRAMLALARAPDDGLTLRASHRGRHVDPGSLPAPGARGPPAIGARGGDAGPDGRVPPGEAGLVDQPAGRHRGRRGRQPPPDVRPARRSMRRWTDIARSTTCSSAARRPCSRRWPGRALRPLAVPGISTACAGGDPSGVPSALRAMRPGQEGPMVPLQTHTKLVILSAVSGAPGRADAERTHRDAWDRTRDRAARGARGAPATAAAARRGRAPGWTWHPSTAADAGAAASGVDRRPSSAVTSTAVVGTVTITAFDLGFKPATLSVPVAGRYTVVVQQLGRDRRTT